MTMKRLCLTTLLALWCLCAPAAEKSPTIVYINGAKYYVHTVQPGETLYALSKSYNVSEKVILENNPSAADGLKASAVLKIPFVARVSEQLPDRKLRRTFDFHTVEKGETLYAISRRYEIPIQTIIEDNPTLDPIHLRLGERILIRRKQIGSEDEAGTQQQWEAYRNSLNSVAEAGTSYHIVHPGETFYSLSRRFGITEEELGRLNGGLKAADLKAGAMIKVPGEASPEPAADLADTLSLPADAGRYIDERVEEIDFRALRSDQPLDVALLLPLAVNGQPTTQKAKTTADGDTLLPIRAVAEALGMSVRWDAKQGAVVSYGDDMVKPAPLTTETLMTAMPGGAIAAVNSDGTTEEVYGTCVKEAGVTYVSRSALAQALDLYLAD